VGQGAATLIVMRALRWPDAFPATDHALRRIAGEHASAERLRPWRAYAAMHLWLGDDR
jgi:AraC family transcriptional regulator of adaptative response / DNA-3-methyladenine glycosylase II